MIQRSALIIEDDPKLGVIFQTALQQAGFETELDATGDQFSNKLSSVPPDLVILDIHLPYASGKDIFDQIRSNELWSNTVVIVTTADLFLSKSLEKQADYVLIKPVSVGRLMKIVANRWPEDVKPY
ncbi:MAG: response regulator transcription factor [Anaerolineales bacterium]|nr:response regulator transcription factor [Anaerolineales bacterium]